MASSAVMRGPVGEVRWAYTQAAAVADWSVQSDPSGYTLTAKVVSQNTFAVSQRPLVFRVSRPTGFWIWPVTSLQIEGSTVTASLGAPE